MGTGFAEIMGDRFVWQGVLGKIAALRNMAGGTGAGIHGLSLLRTVLNLGNAWAVPRPWANNARPGFPSR